MRLVTPRQGRSCLESIGWICQNGGCGIGKAAGSSTQLPSSVWFGTKGIFRIVGRHFFFFFRHQGSSWRERANGRAVGSLQCSKGHCLFGSSHDGSVVSVCWLMMSDIVEIQNTTMIDATHRWIIQYVLLKGGGAIVFLNIER